MKKILLVLVSFIWAGSAIQANDQVMMAQKIGQMPLAFTKNVGQWNERVLFRADAGLATIWITGEGIYYQFTKRLAGKSNSNESTELPVDDIFPQQLDSIEQLILKASFVESIPITDGIGQEPLDYKCNYFLGSDPSRWRTNVPNYRAILLKGVYPGIDLMFYGDGLKMEYDFIVSAGSDPSQIRVQYEGAESISVNAAGELIVETKFGSVIESPPLIYQVENGSRNRVEGEYELVSANSFRFRLVDKYDQRLPLVLDPVVTYSSYLGGSADEMGNDVAVDNNGNIFVTGYTNSADFQMQNPYDGSYNGAGQFGDAYVCKFTSEGQSLSYSTYLGGGSDDFGRGIAVDAEGNVYIVGRTESFDFPKKYPYDDNLSGSRDVFLTKLAPTGDSLIYSSYLGGSNADDPTHLALDAVGCAYVTGQTISGDFPTVNALDGTLDGYDAFLTKFSPQGNSLLYSTYLGGSLEESGNDIAADNSGNAYITGQTHSSNFPTKNAYDGSLSGGNDAFVTKIATGAVGANALIYSTYFGGSNNDVGTAITVDVNGSAYIAGRTGSVDLPPVNAFDGTFNGGGTLNYPYDAFVGKLSVSGGTLQLCTYLGGENGDGAYGIALDPDGDIWVAGSTASSNMPMMNAYDPSFNGNPYDVFVAELSPLGNALKYSTYLGGENGDYGHRIRADAAGNIFVTGYTLSTGFPKINPYDGAMNGSSDAFVTKLSGEEPPFCTGFGGLFCDDFEDGDEDGWAHDGMNLGVWSATGGVYDAQLAVSEGITWRFIGNRDWGNIHVGFDFTSLAGVDKLIYTRWSVSGPDGYLIRIRTNYGSFNQSNISVSKYVNNVSQTTNTYPVVTQTGVTYHVEFDIIGNSIACSLDGVPKFTYVDAEGRYPTGILGLGLTHTMQEFLHVQFDNVTVECDAGSTCVPFANASGFVYDAVTSAPLEGVLVRFLQNDVLRYETSTNINGYYSIGMIDAGDYDLDFILDGYPTYSIPATLIQNHNNVIGTVRLGGLTALIDNITPNPAMFGGNVSFMGHGTDVDGSITGWNWRSSIDGQLSTAASFVTNTLSVGNHTIYFRVQDNVGGWSPEVSAPLQIYSQSNCVSITPTMTICADNVIEDPQLKYTLSGNVTINNILRLGGNVVVDKRVNLSYPEVQGSGSLVATSIIGTDYTLYGGSGDYALYAEDNHLKAHDAGGLIRGDFQLCGFQVNLGDFTIDPNGQFLQTRYTVDMVYPLDKVLENLSTEHPGDFPGYFDEASFGRTYSRTSGVSTYGDIGPLGVNLKLWALYDVEVHWNQAEGIYGGSFKVKIPGGPGKSSNNIPAVPVTPVDVQDQAILVEIRDRTGSIVGTTDLGAFLEIAATGAFLDGFGVEIEFMPGGINRLIVTLTGSIPLGHTGLRITEMNGGIIDAQTNLKVEASVDIETLIPELPLIGPPIKMDDLGIIARPFSYLRGKGTLEVCSYDLSGAEIEYEGANGKSSLSATGYLDLANLFVGKVNMGISGTGFQGSGDMTMKTPADLPWGFGWAENQVISAVKADINNADFRGQGQIWKLSLAQRVQFGKPSFPGFHYYIGTNYGNLVKIWKRVKSYRQEIEFQVPNNCPQILAITGNDSYLYDFVLHSPSGITYDSTYVNYRRFESTLQTAIVIDYPEPGVWRFVTEETGEIQMEALGENLSAVMKFELPNTRKSESSVISLGLNDYSDTLAVEIYWDTDRSGFDGEFIARFNVENGAMVNFAWNTTSLPGGEYFIYCRADDGNNAPIKQYAPGSIWVDNYPDIEVPENLSVSREGDSLRVSWNTPIAGDLIGTVIYIRRISDGITTSYAVVDTNVAFVHDLNTSSRYEINAAFVNTNGNLGRRSSSVLYDYVDGSQNNSPFFTLNLDSTWYFVIDEGKQYELTATDFDSDPLTFSGIGLPPGASIVGTTLDWMPDNDSLAGYHAFSLIVSDGQEGADTLQWGALVFKSEDVNIEVRFSSPNLYEGDNMYVLVSNMSAIDSQVEVMVENLNNTQQAIISCDRVDDLEYIGPISLSASGASVIQVAHGDSLKATYTYDGFTYIAYCRFDTTVQPRDITPPQAIADLQYLRISDDTLLIYWTAPGDDSALGQALCYDLRYSYKPIDDEGEYLAAFRYSDVVYPGMPNQVDSTKILISRLEERGNHAAVYLVLKTEDESMNRSEMSNMVTIIVGNYVCGDANGDGSINVGDAVFVINYVFKGSSEPSPKCAGNANGDASVNVGDAVFLINRVFKGGPPPNPNCCP